MQLQAEAISPSGTIGFEKFQANVLQHFGLTSERMDRFL